MRVCTTAILFLLSFHSSFSQKNDYVWLSGYMGDTSGFIGYYPPAGFYFGTTTIDFHFSPEKIEWDSTRRMNFDYTNTSFCDSSGNLMFYTNGVYIANSLDEKIENSDTLNAGIYYDFYPFARKFGYRAKQGIVALPSPSNENQYFLLHSWIDSFTIGWGLSFQGEKVLYTLLDMSENAGHGKVLSKNNTLVDGLCGLSLSATRHGNGKDWWVLVQKKGGNCYHRVLLDNQGVNVQNQLTCGGPNIPAEDFGGAAFSPDGSKYAYMSHDKGLTVFDFDRCTGVLSNAINLPFPEIAAAPGANRLGVSFSPNSRFLYLSTGWYLFQFDLAEANVFASMDTVGIYDSTEAPFATFFGNMQLAPDGKIYISSENSNIVYDVITRPNERGDSCAFQPHSVNLPSPSLSVPHFPNYRLGALSGSACDSLTGLEGTLRNERERILKVFPNPTTDYVVVDYGYTDWNKGEIQLEVVNTVGQLMHQQELPLYSGFQKLLVKEFSSGTYTVYIKRDGQVIAVSRFVKE